MSLLSELEDDVIFRFITGTTAFTGVAIFTLLELEDEDGFL